MAATNTPKKINPVTVARQAAKKSIDPTTFAIIAALDNSAENKAVLLENIGPLFMGAERHNPQVATMLARAVFGMTGATGEKYAHAFTYVNKDGDTVTFDGTPRAVVTMATRLGSLSSLLVDGAERALVHAQGSGYADKVKGAEKALAKARESAQTESVRKTQARVNARLALLSDVIEQCRAWSETAKAPKAEKAPKAGKAALVTADTLMPA